MATYDGDQPTTTTLLIRGVHVNASSAIVAAALPASTGFRFTASFLHGSTHYRRGQVYSFSAAQQASLVASSAPMVAVN